MTYSEVLSAIHSRRTFSTGGPTLDRIRRLMDRLGNPQEDFKVIHVAGTNGKGSASAMLHGALSANGYKTGLFTSPYLKDFRERIRISHAMIPEEMLIDCYETVMAHQSSLEEEGYEPVNEFELVTAIGFLAFSQTKMDYVVLEVGLGGRTDPTNLIKKPEAALIMPISLDHTAVLGDTVAQIAREKAGIIKNGCPVISALQEPDAMDVITEVAKEYNAPLYISECATVISRNKTGTEFCCGDESLYISLLGDHQAQNASAVWMVLSVIGLANEMSKMALRQVWWPGRLQYFPGSPEILVDAGHNEAGVKALCGALDSLFAHKKFISIMAMMKDKDHRFCISEIGKRSGLLIGTSVFQPRSLSPEEVAAEASEYCPAVSAISIREAIEMARTKAEPDDLILICGSVYAAGDALVTLEG